METAQKVFRPLVVALILAAGAVSAADQPLHLFILSGQSNMNALDPATSFTPIVTKEFGTENVIVVKDALGGQPIRRWYKQWHLENAPPPAGTGDLYDRLMTKVRPAIEGKTITTTTFVWMQGESDAAPNQAAVYAASLRGLRQQLQADLKTEINFVIGRISDYDKSPGWMLVREAEVQVAETDPRTAWVDTDDLNDPGNGLHYTAAGYVELGKRFAEKSIQLIRKPAK